MVPSAPNLSFYYERVLELVRCFFCIKCGDRVVFPLLIWCVSSIHFLILDQLGVTGVTPTGHVDNPISVQLGGVS